MTGTPDLRGAKNLGRWKESGQPRSWIESRQGRWDHADWLALVEGLQKSDFWPLDLDAVALTLEEVKKQHGNLRRWEESGQPRRWVESRQGQWNHADWLSLLETLQASEFWPLDPDAVSDVLDEVKTRYGNLRRWRGSGQPGRWIESRRGQWSQSDWLALVESLRGSDFWPLDPDAVRGVLDEVKSEIDNLRRWQEVGLPRLWVGAHGGRWDHDNWLSLVDILKRSGFWPLDLGAVSGVLDEVKTRYWNLRRWKESGEPRSWVESHQGQWEHSDWLALLEGLQRSEFWPMYPDAVNGVLEEVKREAANLRRLQADGLPRMWVGARGGRWNHDDWVSLVEMLKRLGFWPLDLTAVGQVLEEAVQDSHRDVP